MNPLLYICVPTVEERAQSYLRTTQAYADTVTDRWDVQLLSVGGRPTCGAAWQEMGTRAYGDAQDADRLHNAYLHFGSDDLVPHPGWLEAAAAECENGFEPAPCVLRPDGTVESQGGWNITRPAGSIVDCSYVPFFPLALWPDVSPIPPIHLLSDNWISDCLAHAGMVARVNPAYLFTHHHLMAGRINTIATDQRLYAEARAARGLQ